MTTWRKSFIRPLTGQRSESLRELYQECSEQERALSPDFPARYLAGRAGDLTPFSGIRQGPGVLHRFKSVAGRETGDWCARLEDALSRLASGATEIAVAVSGGID